MLDMHDERTFYVAKASSVQVSTYSDSAGNQQKVFVQEDHVIGWACFWNFLPEHDWTLITLFGAPSSILIFVVPMGLQYLWRFAAIPE
jgi:hypothetical protein